MPDTRIQDINGGTATTPAGGDFIPYVTSDGLNTYITTPNLLDKRIVRTINGTISNPQAVYAQAASLPIIQADAALTITGIYIDTRQTAQEMAGDLKFADDQTIGTLANAIVIDVCDTTSGVFSATSSFDDATVPSGKYIYYQFDASPNAAIKDFTLKITYTYD